MTRLHVEEILTILVQVLDDSREVLLGPLVKVGDGDTRGKDGVVRVLRGEVRGSFSGKILSVHVSTF